MRKKPYLIDGLIGNGNMLLTLTKDGVIQRLNWPRIDYIDQVNDQWAGMWSDDHNRTVFFHDAEYEHEQFYQEDSNILVTRHVSKEWTVEQKDYVLPDKNVWVRNFEITNSGETEKEASFLYYSASSLEGHSKFQTTKFNMDADSLVHYYRKTAMAVTPSEHVSLYQAGKAKQQAETNQLEGRSILNHPEGAVSISLGSVKPGEAKSLAFFISLAETEEEAVDATLKAKQAGEPALQKQTAGYWHDVLKERKDYGLQDSRREAVYKRSILTFHLLQNKETGAFIAGPEVDDDYDFSGGYAYCWGRDAAFIASAVDAAGYPELVSKFYHFMTRIQSEDGSWDQRHFTDGGLAPTWGMQIDETGSILWGINEHYQLTRDEDFRDQVWETVKRGADFLCNFIDPETNLPLPSKDLWEKRDGEHLYSAAAVYGGLTGAAQLAEEKQYAKLAEKYRNQAEGIKEAVVTSGWNEQENRFVRSLKLTVPAERYELEKAGGKRVLDQANKKGIKEYLIWEDTTPDISLLGLAYPFGMIDISDEKLKATANAIEDTCTSKKIGGIERFPEDVYIGGNPWILSTLWMAIFKVKNFRNKEAEELFDWATKYANHLDLLPEQIDKETGEPAWVMPLTWSHAMYVLSIKEFTEAKI